jgi:hypothetical protein
VITLSSRRTCPTASARYILSETGGSQAAHSGVRSCRIDWLEVRAQRSNRRRAAWWLFAERLIQQMRRAKAYEELRWVGRTSRLAGRYPAVIDGVSLSLCRTTAGCRDLRSATLLWPSQDHRPSSPPTGASLQPRLDQLPDCLAASDAGLIGVSVEYDDERERNASRHEDWQPPRRCWARRKLQYRLVPRLEDACLHTNSMQLKNFRSDKGRR